MLLPEIKEREYRFKLALRMGLPIFALILALISNTLITTYESLQPIFYFESILLLAFSIYFIFYLIYRGFDERITENVSKTFTREYLYKYLKKKIKRKKEYTLILLSIDNIVDINARYGIKNRDKILYEFVKYVNKYFQDKKIHNFPMGHIKDGDFILGLDGEKDKYNSILEILCIKSSELSIDDIEVNISGTITDTSFSNNLDYMIENLFELQEKNRNKKTISSENEIDPSDLESYVIEAIKEKSISIMTQKVYENNIPIIEEYFIKLKASDGKILHPKSYMKIVNKLGLTTQYDLLKLQKSIIICIDKDPINFAISISPTSLRNHNFLTKAKEIINENPHAKGKIIFILSEIEYYSHIDKYNSILLSLKELGVKIAIDRLGSIHTSFLYFRDLDIDIVRFDPFYNKDIKNDKYNSIIKGFNSMAHIKGVKTWIKMVENKELKEFAQKINIDYIQGKELANLEKHYEDK
ncbi:EAL domain-containing protein [Sulfurimonas sp.]